MIAVIGAATSFVPSIGYGIHAASQGHRHLGHRIYFKWDDIKTKTHPALLPALADAKANQELIARYYSFKLSGSYDKESTMGFFQAPRKACEYLAGESDSRGVCRHKSIILKAILDELGIPAQIQIGYGKSSIPHMWVYLLELDMVADPTAGTVEPSEDFYTVFFDGHPEKVNSIPRRLFNFNNWWLTPFEQGWFY